MALRDQPYLPLYVQDFLTDEKLIECSAQATGVYIRLMCIMHKTEEYGVILLKQKDKQEENQIKNFALKLLKQMPYTIDVIFNSLTELIEENVITISGEKLYQKRMVKDNDISEKRSLSGSKGGKFAQAKIKANSKAKSQANTEYENEYENENESITNTEFVKEKPLWAFEFKNYNPEIKYPFEFPEFCSIWDLWIEYRKEKKLSKYKKIGEQAALKSLSELSNNSIETAKKIIEQSISNNWQGLFEVKNNGRNNNNQKPISKYSPMHPDNQ